LADGNKLNENDYICIQEELVNLYLSQSQLRLCCFFMAADTIGVSTSTTTCIVFTTA
jgi:hypothetical protein